MSLIHGLNSSGEKEPIKSIGGSQKMYGLARKGVRVSATAYSTTETHGFRVLLKGSGTLTLSFVGGGSAVVITAAELTEMGAAIYEDWPVHLSSITAGTGMEILAYIPE